MKDFNIDQETLNCDEGMNDQLDKRSYNRDLCQDNKRCDNKARLKEYEDRFNQLFNNSPFAIILLDEEGKVIDCNPATFELTGYSKEDFSGKTYFSDFTNKKLTKKLIKRRESILKGENHPPMVIEFYKKDATQIWVEVQDSLVSFGNRRRIQLFCLNVTNRKVAEALIREEISRLKELDNMRKNIISRVSHELKTPLMTINNASELLLTAFPDSLQDEILEIVHIIQRGGKRLYRLVENLINISRIEFNKLSLSKKPTDLTKLIKETTNEFSYQLQKKQIKLSLELPSEALVSVDKLRIEQVFTNLVSNAIKNTPPQGKINIRLESNEKWVKTTVKDSGIGLTKLEKKRVFTRFGKFERYGDGLEYIDIQGSGLGLFISQEIIKLHEGFIRARSEGRHKGATFEVLLPREKSVTNLNSF